MSVGNKVCKARCEFECHKLVPSDKINIVEDTDQTERFICSNCLPKHRNLAVVRMKIPNERI